MVADSFEDLETVPKHCLLAVEIACPEGDLGPALGERRRGHPETGVGIHLACVAAELAGTFDFPFHGVQASDVSVRPRRREQAVLVCS